MRLNFVGEVIYVTDIDYMSVNHGHENEIVRSVGFT